VAAVPLLAVPWVAVPLLAVPAERQEQAAQPVQAELGLQVEPRVRFGAQAG